MKRSIHQVALLGSYLPRQCGIATFTHDVHHWLRHVRPDWSVSVVALNDLRGPYQYPDEVKFEIDQNPSSYQRAARYLTARQYDALYIQHEFGLFGGAAGDLLFELLDTIRIPVVTMLHTVLENPDESQFRVLRRLAARSANVITMSPRGQSMLQDIYELPAEKIHVIPHGIPDTAFVDPIFYKEKFDLLDNKVALTFGLLSPGKGIENAIKALPAVVQQHPTLKYVILGATHPNLVREQGEEYRESLMKLATDLKVRDNVRFVNQFVDLDELVEYIAAADIYLTPYLNEAQITSGTLSYAYGCGNAVISTPYWHALELLSNGSGRIVPFNDSNAIAEQMNDLLNNESDRHRMRKHAYLEGRQMIWPVVAEQMAQLVEEAHNNMFAAIDFVAPFTPHAPTSLSMRETLDDASALRRMAASRPERLADELAEHVEIHLDHLVALTDDTGLVQHATYDMPNLHEGYCTDDNIRGLLLTSLLRPFSHRPSVIDQLDRRYRTFVNFAFHPEDKRIRNFLSVDRRWLESVGSDDCIGRVAWALGICVATGPQPDVEAWAVGRFEEAMQQCVATTSPRSWAFGILGASQYQRHFAGERLSKSLIQTLAERLQLCYESCADAQWHWFENCVTYDNARLAEAMLVAGEVCGQPRFTEIGLKSLRWLCDLQKTPERFFRPIGNQGFYQRGMERPIFDQQPLEAWATVSATLQALRLTGDERWGIESDLALAWFLGCNDLRANIANVRTGGCHDGLQYDSVNRNQGAESTLSWLIAATQWKLQRRQSKSPLSNSAQLPINLDNNSSTFTVANVDA